MEEKTTSENHEEISEDSIKAERMPDAYDIDLNARGSGEDESLNDSISEHLIQIDEKQETEDDLGDANDSLDADSVYVCHSSQVTMRTKPSQQILKPPKFNGAPGFILRALNEEENEVNIVFSKPLII